MHALATTQGGRTKRFQQKLELPLLQVSELVGPCLLLVVRSSESWGAYQRIVALSQLYLPILSPANVNCCNKDEGRKHLLYARADGGLNTC